jgi:hypothetical protein
MHLFAVGIYQKATFTVESGKINDYYHLVSIAKA